MNKIETFAEYQQLANRTCPDLGKPSDNILHMKLGLITEIGETLDIFKKKLAYKKEIDLVNLGEELADQFWYLANLALITEDKSFNISVADVNISVKDNVPLPVSLQKKFDDSVNILSHLLKNLFNSDEKGKINIINHIVSLSALCDIWELDLMQTLTNNITKLQVRYPDKFTNEAALNRNLQAERKALEKKATPIKKLEKVPKDIEEVAPAVEQDNVEGRL